MTKKQYLQPEMMVSDIQPNTMVLTGSPTLPDPDNLGMGGGLDPGEAI